jgi:hypothetical protein
MLSLDDGIEQQQINGRFANRPVHVAAGKNQIKRALEL